MAENEVQESTETKNEKSETPKEFAKLVEQLDKMSALEVSQLVKHLEEHWGVSAAAPAIAVAAPSDAEGGPAAEEAKKSLEDAGATVELG
jgi:ribosomal protein L7/L12